MIGWVVAAVYCVLAFCAGATAAPEPPTPELLVLVSGAANGMDHVAISYAGDVSEQQARRELQALLKATGWTAGNLIVDAQAPMPGEPRMTSVSFTAPAVIPYPEGLLPVAPLIETYREQRNLVLLFQPQRPFQLMGPSSYEDRYLTVKLRQNPGNYRYDVTIADPSFTKLELPRLATADAQEDTGQKRRAPLWLALLLSVGVAVCVGFAVYLFAAGRTSRGSSGPGARR